MLKAHFLPAIPIHGLRTLPLLLTPAFTAAVEVGLAAFVGFEGVGFVAVEGVDFGVADAVGYSADCLSEEGSLSRVSTA